MTEEEDIELQTLNNCVDMINKKADDLIKGLTVKALTIKIEEKDRIEILGRRAGIINFLQTLDERHRALAEKKQKER